MYTYEMYLKNENKLKALEKESSDAANIEIMTGASASTDGKEGLVPAPVSANRDKYLKGDGTWSDVEFSTKAEQDTSGNNIVESYAKRSLFRDNCISIRNNNEKSIQPYSIIIGEDNIGNYQGDIILGNSNKVNYPYSYAFGKENIIGEKYSIAVGEKNNMNGICSSCFGFEIENKSHFCLAIGSDNAVDNRQSYLFIVGNGLGADERSNAFSVDCNGLTKAASTITAETTADYAEFFEWTDGNLNAEDRVGKFVTLYEDKITIATSNEDYILGIVSGAPFVLGNGDCDVWTGMWMRDEFNRVIYEPAPKMEFDEETNSMKEVFDEDGNLVYEGKRRKLNPEYDSTQKYISRFDRPEWTPVGMLGVLSVLQDGTCEVNGYCCCNSEGIATACDKNTIGSYRVIKKISDQVVRVVFR